MKLSQYAKSLLLSENFEDKLLHADSIEFDSFELLDPPKVPAREKKYQFSNKQIKFPKATTLHLDQNKAIALGSFANHELLAIEMMACALLIYPHKTNEEKKAKLGIINAIKDEQKHFKLYVNRMKELGYEFGDFPLNDYFWSQMPKLKSFPHFFSVMSLTFEAANLDFAFFYRDIFKKYDDLKTSKIMEVVLEDEISHVSLGAHFCNNWREDKSLWQYYLDHLPLHITPNRSKGIKFVESLRVKANLPQDFIDRLKNYQDDFEVTNRKSWKS